MKLKIVTTSILMACAMSANAEFMMGPPEDVREQAFDIISSYTDDATTADLQDQQANLSDLKAQLETLQAAETVDEDAVADVLSQLQDAAQTLRSDVQNIVSDNEELQTALSDLRPEGVGGGRPEGVGGSRPEGVGGSRPEGVGGNRPEGVSGGRPSGFGGGRPSWGG